MKETITRQIIVGEPIGFGAGKLHAPELSQQQAESEAKDLVYNYMVPVRDGACSQCIDGRNCIHSLVHTAPGEPGPKVAGNALVTAFAAAELTPGFYGDKSAVTTAGRMQEIANELDANDIPASAHTADGAVVINFQDAEGRPKTGCGAGENLPKSVAMIAENDPDIVGTAVSLLHIDASSVPPLRAPADVAAANRDYNCMDVLNTVKDKQNIEVLVGAHGEQLVVFNYVEGMTIDRDRYANETGKQVFVVDMWFIDKIAHALADGRPDFERVYPALLYAMTAFQVATYKSLCDGSHRPVVVAPQTA